MRRTQRALKPGLLAVVLLLAACGGEGDEGGASIAGTYSCGPEEETGQPQETWELRDDETLAINPPEGPEGTWSAEGDSLVVTIEGQEDRFTIEGDGFVASEAGPGGWVCTRV
jgi:hypothetical protein